MKQKIKIYASIFLPIIILLLNFSFASPEISVSWYTNLLEISGNIIYIILWPVLVITGMALWNGLVTGNIFGLTESIYKFWLLMRNFAFLTLAAIILYDVVKWLINSKIFDVAKNIPKYILAWVLIPFSWYFVVFLVSVSNLLIVWVWELPLNFRDNIAKTKDAKILSVNVYLNLADKVQTTDFFRFTAYYTNAINWKAENYITCPFKNPNQKSQNVTDAWNTIFDKWAYYDAIYQSDMDAEALRIKKNFGVIINTDYCAINQRNLMALVWNYKNDCVPISNTSDNIPTSTSCFRIYILGDKWDYVPTPGYTTALIAWEKHIWENNVSMISTDGNNSMVWPLYTIYGSLLNFASISASNVWSTTEVQLMEFLLKFIVSLLAIIPLIGIAVLCIVRVWLIWIIMIFSPFIVLINCLKTRSTKDDNDMIWKSETFWWKGRIASMTRDAGEIVKLIFQPVILIFWLGLWLIFLQTINYKLSGNVSRWSLMWMEVSKNGNKELQFNSNTTNINIKLPQDTFGNSIFFNLFQWLIMNIFGILIMRQIWMMGTKFSKITEKLWGDIQTFGEKIIKESRLIPLPIGENGKLERVSMQSITDWYKKSKSDVIWYYEEKFKDRSYEEIIKPPIEDLKFQMSDESEEANKTLYEETDKITQDANFWSKTSSQKANDFATLFTKSWFVNKPWNLKSSSSLNDAARKLGLNNFEQATNNSDFARSLFENPSVDLDEVFGKYTPTANIFKKNIMYSLSSPTSDTNVTKFITKPLAWITYLKKNKDDGIFIIWYEGIKDGKILFEEPPIYTLPNWKSIIEWNANIELINTFIKENWKDNLKKIYSGVNFGASQTITVNGVANTFVPDVEIKANKWAETYKRDAATETYKL